MDRGREGEIINELALPVTPIARTLFGGFASLASRSPGTEERQGGGGGGGGGGTAVSFDFGAEIACFLVRNQLQINQLSSHPNLPLRDAKCPMTLVILHYGMQNV